MPSAPLAQPHLFFGRSSEEGKRAHKSRSTERAGGQGSQDATDEKTSGSKRKHDPQLDNPQLDSVFLYEGGEVAWERQSEITRVRIGPQVKDIPPDAFRGCRNLAEVQFDEGSLEVIGDCAFLGCKALREVAIPSSVTKLGSNAFEGCSNLAKVQFHEGLEIIKESAFQGCTLQQVYIPSSVTKLGDSAFFKCINLAEVQFKEGIEIIGECAFYECTALQQVILPSSVTELGGWAFSGCSNLASVKFGEGLEIIAECAFWGCSNLASVHFSEGLEIICESAFDECTALRSVTVPSSVTKLGHGSFGDCTNLTEVILLCGERLLNQGFLDRGLLDGESALNKKKLNEMIGIGNALRDDCPLATSAFVPCSLTTLKISIPWALCNRMQRLPEECRLSIEQRLNDLRRLELTQDGNILACFPLVRRPSCWNSVEDTNDETAESIHQALRLICFHELKELSILIELAMWKSRLVEDRARADCRTSVPDPAKSLIMDYCGVMGFLEPAIEGA
ncbi:hypothetical protein THAOC_07570 [Thalassiosira oceanica]|uniref:Leucine-rich repeat protein n=1 Tax=Thalassiosira oceanica TaxID=159749 RepID=K0T006_THAOC|nr:hypothetical protein THAOC_07570 [Thalassiosira oceanica]|eukprot:EJK71025.1 hypothetical protein THAOC_07570 [Thalassiosira oceanica]